MVFSEEDKAIVKFVSRKRLGPMGMIRVFSEKLEVTWLGQTAAGNRDDEPEKEEWPARICSHQREHNQLLKNWL